MFAHTAASDVIAGLLFSFVLRYDAHGNYVPDLATDVPSVRNGGISPDGKTIIVHLRKGVVLVRRRAADRRRLALYLSCRARIRATTSRRTYGWDEIASERAPRSVHDRHSPEEPKRRGFRHSRHRRRGISAVAGASSRANWPNSTRTTFNEQPISSGPFVLQHGITAASLDVRAEPSLLPRRAAAAAGDLEGRSGRQHALQRAAAHEIDVYPSVSVHVIPRLSSVSGIVVVHRLIANWRHLGINMSRPQLADVRVRRALEEAVDWKPHQATVYHGINPLAVSDIFPESWAAPVLPPYRYDPAAARRLLAAAGWHTGPDGVLAQRTARRCV